MRYIKDDDNINIYDRFLTPEESLIVALIENAVIDAFMPISNKKRYYKDIKIEALRWLFDDDKTKSSWTLGWCFDILDLNIDDKIPIIKQIYEFRKSLNFKKKEIKENERLETHY